MASESATSGSYEAWQRVAIELPNRVSGAAELCALPNELDDGLALFLLERIGQMNGTSPRALSELKHMPFVSETGATWQLAEGARAVLIESFQRRSPSVFLSAHRVASEALEGRRGAIEEKASAKARRLQWNLAFHLAPIDAGAAIRELDDLVERGAALNAIGDLRAVVDLAKTQREWLTGKELDVLYYEGRLAYETGDFRTAQEKLQPVWESSGDRKKRLFAGHFLGTIWAGPDYGHRWDDAFATLVAASRLADEMNDLRGEAMILNTLGSLQVRRDEPRDRASGQSNLRRSVRLSRAVGDLRTEAYALMALAGALMKSGGRDSLDEAEGHLRRRLDLERQLPDLEEQGATTDALGRLLARAAPARRGEAVELLEHGIERARERGDARQLALSLEALGELLSRGDAPELDRAAELLAESLRIGRERQDRRHQAIVLSRLAAIAERLGQLSEAVEMLTEVVELNRARHDHRRADEVQRRLDRLRR
jgi:tetratricopeptide (TPR) repeat protein